ncbi:hypothetical protein ACLOJK_025510 [Asimina triloba]
MDGRAVTCGPSNISVTQRETGRVVEGDVEFEVTITNTCSCSQSNVIVSCSGFSTVETLDPNKFKKLNDQVRCLVNNGQPIQPSASIIFTYAWHTPFNLPPLSSNGSC